MRIIAILSIALAMFAFSKINTSISLQQAINNGAVKVKIKSLGQYQGESTVMEIQNLTKSDLHIMVEPGRKLIADKEEFQNL